MDIKGNSVDDGPGTRSVVFFKGCPLNCFWCQNPESKRAEAELFFDKASCVQSYECIPACPERAIAKGDPIAIDREKCTRCFDCTEVCPSTALKRMGAAMSVEEIVAKILPYKSFFDTSGGGVTLSGGEPTLFMDFTSELLARLKQEGIHTLVETAGLFDLVAFERKILPFVDLIFMDIKIVDPVEHRKWCGVDNAIILENFTRLFERSKCEAFEIKPRTPLIPGVTDTEDKMFALARFYEQVSVRRAALMKNNPIWFDKFEKIGMTSTVSKDSPMRDFYDADTYRRLKKLFEDRGIEILES